MQLKRWDAVDWLELPRIEHPTHACHILERMININGSDVCWVRGLQDVLWSDTQWTSNGVLNRDSHATLMRRVSQGEVYLVYDIGLEPAFPLLRRMKGENSDRWTINDDTLDYFVRDRVDWMLSRAIETKGIWAPVIVPKIATTEKTPAKNEAPKQSWLGVDVLGTLSLQGNVEAVNDQWKRTRIITAPTNKHSESTQITYSHTLTTKQTNLALVYNDVRIPLGFEKFDTTEKKPTGAVEHTILAPLLLRRFTTPERDFKDGGLLDEGYHVYLFLDGHLWRELKVSKNGVFHDIDLGKEYGKEERKPSGIELRSVVVPVKLNNRTPKIEIAIAPRQWGWARVLAFGGMHEKDPRKGHDKIKAVAVSNSKRSARLVTLNLDKLQNSQLQAPWFSPKDYPDREDLKSFKSSGLPVCQLDDPFNLALDAGIKVNDYIDKLKACLADIQKDQNYKSAVTSYQLFFNDALYAKTPWQGRRMPSFKMHDSQSVDFRDAAKSLDKHYIEKILEIHKRKDLRKQIRDGLAMQAATMGGYLLPEQGQQHGKPIREVYPEAITFDAVMEDYAYLIGRNYLELWKTFTAYAGNLNFDPSDIDRGNDLPSTKSDEKPLLRPGSWYLDGVLKKNETLKSMLFPKDEDVNPYAEDGPHTKHNNTSEKIENSEFRLGDFMSAALEAEEKNGSEGKEEKNEAADKTVEGGAKYTNSVVSSFLTLFAKQWKDAITQKSTVELEMMVRYAKASGSPQVKGLHLIPKNGSLGNKIILDGSWHLGERLTRQKRRHEVKLDTAGKQTTVQIVDPLTEKVIGSERISDIAHNRGGTGSIDMEQWNRMWRELDTDHTYKATATFVVIPEINPIAKKLHLGEYARVERDTAFKATALKWGGKTLPPVLTVFELMNTTMAIEEFLESTKDLKKRIKAFQAAASLMISAGEATKALMGQERLEEMAHDSRIAKALTTELEIKGVTKLASLEAGNLALAVTGCCIAFWDACSAFKNDNDDGGWANLANAGALLFQAASLIGVGAEAAETTGLFAIFIPLAPLAVVAVLAVAITAIAVAIFTDSELVKWAKLGPLSTDLKKRKEMDGVDGYAALLSILAAPKVILKRKEKTTNTPDPADILVEVYAPAWMHGKEILNIQLTAMRDTEKNKVENEINKFKKEFVDVQFSMAPNLYLIELIQQEEKIVGMRYYYHPYMGDLYIYRARARHITSDGITLPAVPKEESEKIKNDDPVSINDSIPGWSYAEELEVYGVPNGDELQEML